MAYRFRFDRLRGTGILERLGTTAETWQALLEKSSKGRFFGCFFAASRQRLRKYEVGRPERRRLASTRLS